MREVTEIGHADASTMIETVRSWLDARGLGAAAAVVDPHGELVAFIRTDGCPLASIANAQNKAFTAARERVESAVIGKKAQEKPFPITNFGDLRYTGWGGGVPVEVDGVVVGAIGVSGLPEVDDIELATLAVAALSAR